MTEKRVRLFSLLLLGTALIFFVLLTAFYSILPGVVESRVIAAIEAKAGLGHLTLRVRSIGFTGTDISDVRLGEKSANGPVIDSIRFEYSPIELVRGRIARIIVSGVFLSLDYQSSVVTVDGLDLRALAASSPDAAPAYTALPFSIGSVSLRNSAVSLRYQDTRIYCPFEMTIHPDNGMTGIERFLIQLSPWAQRLLIAGSLDGLRKVARITLSGDALRLESLSAFSPFSPELRLRGEADIGAQATLALAPFSVTSVSAVCRLRPENVGYQGISIKSPPHVDNTPAAIHLTLSSDDLNGWKIDLSPFTLDFPGGSVSAEAVCSVQPAASGMAVEAEVRTKVSAEAKESSNTSALNTVIPPMRWALSATSAGTTGWQARLNGRIDTQAFDRTKVLQIDRTSLWIGPPEITASAEATATEVSASYRLQVPGVSVRQDKTQVSFPMINLSGTATHSFDGAGQDQLNFSIEIPQTRLSSGTISGQLPEGIRVSGDWINPFQSGAGLTGVIGFSGGSLAFPPRSLVFAGVAAKMPFQWPLTEKATSGSFSIASIKWDKRALGGVKLALRQEADGVNFSGKYDSLLMPKLAVNVLGCVERLADDWRASVQARLPDYHCPEEMDLGRIHSAVAGILFSGEINLSADLNFSAAERHAALSMGMKNAAVRVPEMKAALNGIFAELDFPNMFTLRSAPKQAFRVARMSYGDIEATDLTADFQIESPTSLFIEQSRFKWCRGNISTQSFRISPGVNDYRLTLYCDRLNLADMLRQFGAAKADGEGAVNGKIPLSYSDGKLSFQDGFLYSTPGAGGSIHVTETQMLTSAMSPDSPEYIQMDIAREALKNFEYSWVKMNLGTEGKDLLMRLTFDGKPAGELPFTFKRETGSFVRVTTEAKGSVFQGIRLNVNFRLPLDDILKYKEILNLTK
ncbi:MAG: YdbH domain-containing protein [Desulfobacterales bacterium]|jgi:hypothetical protein|nr:YdbH domain-containing protein [Desulfobacterales bacterium]